tara:strand:- start:352 stop:510 length:159 start_codon:yes stop_codon:yes gene_type:complete
MEICPRFILAQPDSRDGKKRHSFASLELNAKKENSNICSVGSQLLSFGLYGF